VEVVVLLQVGTEDSGLLELTVGRVVVQLKTMAHLAVEPSSRVITAGLFRYGETGVVTRPEVTDLRRVPVVVVRVVPEKTRDAGPEVALEETESALA
jgi:hypothetical protein